MASRDYFKGKRVAVIGLGPHGEMVEDVKFLIKSGALVGLYDLKSEARLKNHLISLRAQGLANYVCGSIPADDLLDMDLIVLSHSYPRESSFLKGAKEKKIPIEYPETLFFRRSPPVTVVGIMGECGKSTIMSMLSPMLEKICDLEEDQGFFAIDPDSGEGIIQNWKKVKSGDLVLVRMTPLLMKEFTSMRLSPHVAVFTTVPGPESYDKSAFEILLHQTYNNYVIASDEIIDASKRDGGLPRSKMLRTKASFLPAEWENGGLFDGWKLHDRDNAALALQAARLFKIEDDDALHALEKWKPLKGRIELVKKLKNVEFYNDSASERSCSSETAVQFLAGERNTVLIFGGAGGADDYGRLYAALPQYVHTLVLLPGSGTMKQRSVIEKIENVEVKSAPSIEEAVRLAMESARKGDKILFSPGFEALGLDNSRKERGERFVKAVRAL